MESGIKVIMTGKCKNCPCFELQTVEEDFFGGLSYQSKNIICENRTLCDRIEKYLTEKISVE